MVLFKKYQFIPFKVMGVILLLIVIYRIGAKDKLDIIKKDFNNPQFIFILFIIFLFLFFVKDPDTNREKQTIEYAVIAGIGAYFGHIDLPLIAILVSGLFAYYLYKPLSNLPEK
jgi:hypothetical protein